MSEILSNQASVNYSYEGAEQTFTNVSNIVNTNIRDRYDFCIEKSATTDCFRAGGEQITFFVTITNCGCQDLSKFNVSDNLGENGNLIYVPGSARLFANGFMQTINPIEISPLTFELSHNLNREENIVLQYSATINPNISLEVSEITNSVTVTASNCEDENAITKSTSLTISRCDFATLQIVKSVSTDEICCGSEYDYTITLTNTGNIDALNVVVTDLMPANFVLTEIHKENNGIDYQYDPSEYTISPQNELTLPNASGRGIDVPAIAPGSDNSTRIRLHGHI